jgi:uncharacterized protein YbjT (DUF2867 family)
MKTALIAGYTGLIGGELLNLLLNSAKYDKVIALGRREINLQHPKLKQVQVDFNKLKLEDKVDDVFCCLGTTIKKAGSQENFRLVDYQFPMNLAMAGLEAEASAILIVTAHGANSKSSIFYNKVKGEVEEGIRSLDYPKIEILRPSLLMGDREDTRLGESIGQLFMKVFSFLFIGPLKNIKGVKGTSVAKALLHYANDSSEGVTVHYSSELQRFN